jgi:putative zinc finger/helix-turn-helix YgiT family protein
MKCIKCETSLVSERTDKYQYHESGLDDVFLLNIIVHRCGTCGSALPEIPNVRQLHLVIALIIIEQKQKLSGKEIRFLRKNLGMKSKDLAAKLGYEPETYSRFENDREPIGDRGDRLMRIWYAAQKEKDIKKYKGLLELIDGFDKIVRGTSWRKSKPIEINPSDLVSRENNCSDKATAIQ